MARVAAAIECGTHAVIDAEVGAYTTSEPVLVEPLLDRLTPGMLVLVDRGLMSFALWRRAVVTGADLLWRVKNSGNAITAHPIQDLPDGSWLARLDPPKNELRDDPAAQPLTVRVIDYTLHDGRRQAGENDPDEITYRLFTSILDPDQASAADLALAYAQRWEIENVFDELKTHQRGPKKVLRSKSPPLALQEIWGHLCCHYAIRTLMADTAAHAGADPDRVSFVAALKLTRRSVAHQGDFRGHR